MAEKNLFFNAFQDASSPTGYDRNYNADDISDWFSIVCENGVVKTNVENGEPQGLKVVAAGGMQFSVKAGKATIKGKGYINDALKTLTCEAAGSTARYDYVVLRYNNVQSTAVTSRKISIEYVKGTNTPPKAENLTRTNDIYELVLAYITVPANGTSLGTIIDTRGDKDLCGWFTAVKGYADYYDAIVTPYEFNGTMPSLGTSIITDLSSNLYNSKYSIVEVYTNGIKEPREAYSVVVGGAYINIVFTTPKAANAKINVILSNFIDGEGLSTAISDYTKWTQTVSNLASAGAYNYICNGVNDNVLISDLAQRFVNDSTLPTNAQLTINVYGSLGITAAYAGDGTQSNRYQWFSIGTPVGSNKRIIVDFTHCDIINVPLIGNTRNVIFNGYNVHVKNARVVANCTADGCVNFIFASNNGDLKAENCYFESLVTSDVYLSYSGTFINCEAYLASKSTHAYGFYLNGASKPCIVIGGRYRIYTGNTASGYVSALAYSASAETGAACVMYGVNIPTVALSGYVQKHALLIYGGYITATGLITALPLTIATGVNQAITGTIPFSR